MIVYVDGAPAHAATGGSPPSPTKPLVVLVHGAGMDATIWQLQTRYLAYHGFLPLAVDLPGHGRTGGPPLASIEAMTDWIAGFIKAAKAELGIDGLGPGDGGPGVGIVGHSMGTFIGLELAATRPELVGSLVLLGTADAMPVHPDLRTAAENDLPAAAALMTSWGHDHPAHIGHNPTPGLWMLGGARALVESSRPGTLATDLTACTAYGTAVDAAARIECPVTVAIGLGDKMTPPRSTAKLVDALPDPAVVELADTGHMLMTENPRAVRDLLVTALDR
jgi:pimeloyl-ACP methyl ester carboxylesterase